MKNNNKNPVFATSNKTVKLIITTISIILPLIIIIITLWKGFFTLWYDPSRDLMSAWANLHKFSFIGPPAGIPGLFYGPYWLWLLSIGLFFSKNPLIVTFIVASLPYVIIYPIIWFKFKNTFGYGATVLGWLLFIFANGITYATQLWNPYPAPLLTLGVIFLLFHLSFTLKRQNINLLSLGIGFLNGLVINFHISYGIALTLGVFVYLISDALKPLIIKTKINKKYYLEHFFAICSVGIGVGISYIPSLIFESRHGFHQTQTLLHTLLQFGNVVTVKGLSKNEIAVEFIKTFERILHIQNPLGYILLPLLVVLFVFLILKNKIVFTPNDKKIFHIIISIFLSVIFIFFTAKNPIWNYHFIGVDLLIIFLITIFVSKTKILKIIMSIWVLVIIFLTYQHTYSKALEPKQSEYLEKIFAVKLIAADAKKVDYTVYPYNAAIYTYDYSYLFSWLVGKNVPFDPGQNKDESLLYLIVPLNKNDRIEDFEEYRGSEKDYKIVKTWTLDDTLIIKKQRIAKL